MHLRGLDISRMTIWIGKYEMYPISNTWVGGEIETISPNDIFIIKWLGTLKVLEIINEPHVDKYGVMRAAISISCDRVLKHMTVSK